MRDRSVMRLANPVGFVFIVFSVATPISAQTARPPSDVDPARARFEDTSRREMQLRSLGSPVKKRDPKEIAAAVAQVQEDFERILTLHNEIGRAVNSGRDLDDRFVSSATGEIRKRASRLRTTLALNKPDAPEKSHNKQHHFKNELLKDALITLCKRIESFVKNPVIKNPGTVDVEQLAKARDDLDWVIQLSGKISTTSENSNSSRK